MATRSEPVPGTDVHPHEAPLVATAFQSPAPARVELVVNPLLGVSPAHLHPVAEPGVLLPFGHPQRLAFDCPVRCGPCLFGQPLADSLGADQSLGDAELHDGVVTGSFGGEEGAEWLALAQCVVVGSDGCSRVHAGAQARAAFSLWSGCREYLCQPAESWTMIDVLFLRSDELDGLADIDEYVDAVREGYRERGEGAQAQPRTRLDNAEPPGFLTAYLAVLPETGAMGGYAYAAGFGNVDAQFVLPLFDAESGELLAILDGASINPWKTGAAGAVGVDALAREDATALGIIGSGTQARGQLFATSTVRDLERVEVFSRTPENRESFAAEMDERLDADVTAVDTSEAAVSGSDIVTTATNATEPVFDGAHLDPGTHVTAMGQYHHSNHELDAMTVERSTYVVDLWGRLDQDAGSYIQAKEAGAISKGHAHAELGEIVAGNVHGRQDVDEITVFDSGGTAIETVAAAKMLYDRAVTEGLGQTLDFSPASEAFPGR